MKTIIYSPGETAGIGPDLFLSLLDEDFFRFLKAKVICLGDKNLFISRAKKLGYNFEISSASKIEDLHEKIGFLENLTCPDISAGVLNSDNAEYIIKKS